MKKQLLNLSAVFAAMFLISSVSFAQLIEPIETMSVPAMTAGGITLDGLITEDAWSDAVAVGELFNSPADFGGATDLSASIHTCWSYEGFYVAFEIQDNEAHIWGALAGKDPSYLFDNVELFFNIDTAGVASDGSLAPDGVQIRICRGLPDTISQVGFGPTAAKADGFDAVPFQIAIDDQGASWNIETLIPWGYIVPSGTLPEDIHAYIDAQKDVVGFDVSVADSDGTDPDVGARDAQLAWDADVAGSGAEEDNAWQDVRAFGIVSLAGTPASSVSTTSANGVQVYPNPASNVVNFRNLNGVNSIEIVNLLGQNVKTVDVSGHDVVLNVSDLASGNYFAIVKSATTSESVKFIVK